MAVASKDQQTKTVVQGLALGTLAQGVVGVSSGKQALESAISFAWRRWPQSSAFPSLHGFQMSNTVWIGMGRSLGRVGACAGWSLSTIAEPVIVHDGWSVIECLDLVADERASPSDWEELGRLFVGAFREDEVTRGE